MSSISVITQLEDTQQSVPWLPVADHSVKAGFPSPAEDVMQERLDIGKLLVKHQACTFLVRASGWSMRDAGINDQDLLVVDRVLRPVHGDIVIAILDAELTVKRLHQANGKTFLQSANPEFPDIHPKPEQTIHFWGVVTAAVTLFRPVGS